jgi:hypothetical protein
MNAAARRLLQPLLPLGFIAFGQFIRVGFVKLIIHIFFGQGTEIENIHRAVHHTS